MANQGQTRTKDLSFEELVTHYQEVLDNCREPSCFREEVLQNVYRSLIEEYRALDRAKPKAPG
jgi:hypothetical protein